MWPRRFARSALSAADQLWVALTPRSVLDSPGLVILALHSLCRSRSQLNDPALAPNQSVCVDDLRMLVDCVLESGFSIVSPAQVAAGLDPNGRHAMLTFDDGYHDNVLAVDVLDEFDVPAAFFVSASHVLEQKAFWWDVVCREMSLAGASRHACEAELRRLKALPSVHIEEVVRARFGSHALRPRGDAGRPFTATELADFARHPWVHIGNHTADHAILTRCSPSEVRRQIGECQSALEAITGVAPIAIAYPNGARSPDIVEAARAAGLRVGVTVEPSKNGVPAADAPELMQLGRFYFHARPDATREFAACRCNVLPSRLARRLLRSG